MTCQIVAFDLRIPKIYFYVIWALTCEIITCFWIQTVILVEKVLMQNSDYCFEKSIIHMSLKMCTFDPFLNTTIYAEEDFKTISFLTVTKIPAHISSYLKASIMAHDYFFPPQVSFEDSSGKKILICHSTRLKYERLNFGNFCNRQKRNIIGILLVLRGFLNLDPGRLSVGQSSHSKICQNIF